MNFKKMLNNPWLILGGAVAVYWFWVRPRSAGAGVTSAPTPGPTGPSPADRARQASIDAVMIALPGETSAQYASRIEDYGRQTGQIMPTMF